VSHPLRAAWVALRGVRTDGAMAPEIALDRQRPAQYVFAQQVERKLSELHAAEAEAKLEKAADAA